VGPILLLQGLLALALVLPIPLCAHDLRYRPQYCAGLPSWRPSHHKIWNRLKLPCWLYALQSFPVALLYPALEKYALAPSCLW
jgi:hypothetical protein